MKPLKFDIAFRLKRAGFPQPEPKKWQEWVTDTGEIIHIDKRFTKRVHFRSFGVEPKKGKDGRYIVERSASVQVLELKKWYYLPNFEDLSKDLPYMLIFGIRLTVERMADLWITKATAPKRFDRWVELQAEKALEKFLETQ